MVTNQSTTSLLEDLIEQGDIDPAAEAAIAGGAQANDGQPGAGDNNQQQPDAGQQQQTDINKILEEKTGGKLKSVDDLIKLVDAPVQEEIKFANEESKKVFEYLKEGKIDEFFESYQQQRQLGSIDKLGVDDVLKLKIKQENPELTEQEVEEEFNFTYGVKEPDIDEELDTPEEIAKEKKRYERERLNMERTKKKDLKEAKEFLNAKKQEIVLPEIKSANSQKPVDTEADEAAIKEYRERYLQKIPATVDGIGGFESKYKDAELDFNTSYLIDQTEKDGLKKNLEKFTLQDYFLPRYIDDNGEFKTDAIARDLYVLENFNKIVDAHVSQAVNHARASFAKNLKNADFQEAARRTDSDEQKVQNDRMVDFFFGNT